MPLSELGGTDYNAARADSFVDAVNERARGWKAAIIRRLERRLDEKGNTISVRTEVKRTFEGTTTDGMTSASREETTTSAISGTTWNDGTAAR